MTHTYEQAVTSHTPLILSLSLSLSLCEKVTPDRKAEASVRDLTDAFDDTDGTKGEAGVHVAIETQVPNRPPIPRPATRVYVRGYIMCMCMCVLKNGGHQPQPQPCHPVIL